MKKISKLLVSFLLPLIASVSVSAGGDVVNNGGGLAERNFTYAFQNLHHFIEKCLEVANPCNLTEKENDVLNEIMWGVEVSKGQGGLIFKSGRMEPGFFEVDEHGKVRVAVTSSNQGAPIYVNLDMIYLEEAAVKKPLSVMAAVAILVHEVGHHYGISDHLFLDKLGAKVQSLNEEFLESIDLQKFKQEKFALKAYNYSSDIRDYPPFQEAVQGRLVIENGYELYDLTAQIAHISVCPEGYAVNGLLFTNLHWKKMEAFDKDHQLQALTMAMDFEYVCRSLQVGVLETPSFSKTLEISTNYKIQVLGTDGEYVEPYFDSEKWIYYPDSLLKLIPGSLKLILTD